MRAGRRCELPVSHELSLLPATTTPLPTTPPTTHTLCTIMAPYSRSSRAAFGRSGYETTNRPMPGPPPINAGRGPVLKPTPPPPPKGLPLPAPQKNDRNENQQDPPSGDKTSRDRAESAQEGVKDQ